MEKKTVFMESSSSEPVIIRRSERRKRSLPAEDILLIDLTRDECCPTALSAQAHKSSKDTPVSSTDISADQISPSCALILGGNGDEAPGLSNIVDHQDTTGTSIGRRCNNIDSTWGENPQLTLKCAETIPRTKSSGIDGYQISEKRISNKGPMHELTSSTVEQNSGYISNRDDKSGVESSGTFVGMESAFSFEWKARARGHSRSVGRNQLPQSKLSSGKFQLSSPKKSNKFVKRQQMRLVGQLNSIPLSCHCEQKWVLGSKATLDRFSRDVTNAWIDYKAPLRTPWTPCGVKEAAVRMICQARMSVDDKLYRCTRFIGREYRGQLFHSSASEPLVALCDVHIAAIQCHLACPGCGIFCEIGEFRSCKKDTGHLYHESCSKFIAAGIVRCGHCLKVSDHIQINIPNPGRPIIESIECCVSDGIDFSLILCPRQTVPEPNAKTNSKYYKDLLTGFRISCIDLPADENVILRDQLEELTVSENTEFHWLQYFKMISCGDVGGVLKFLNFGVNIRNLYVQAKKLQSASHDQFHFPLTGPIHFAIKEHQHVILCILLQVGFPMDFPDKSGFLPFEQAANCENYAALTLLRKFYASCLPCSAIRELSLRRLVAHEKYSSIALLFRYGFYNFYEFSVTFKEIREIIRRMLQSGDSLTIVNVLECRHLVSLLHTRNLGADILIELLSGPNNEFAVESLLKIKIIAQKALPDLGDSLMEFKILSGSTGRCGVAQPENRPKGFVICEDLSEGREFHPVLVVNDVDDSSILPFHYVTDCVVETEKSPTIVGYANQVGCECVASGTCAKSCSCVNLSGSAVYTADGRLDVERFYGQRIVECTRSCSCAGYCQNRIAQNLSRGYFEVFRQDFMDQPWALRSKYILPPGFFVGKITGSILAQTDVFKFIRYDPNEAYLIDCVSPGKAGVISRDYGNYTRYIGRSEENGNVMAVAVITDADIGGIPQIALFTKDVVKAYEPLVLDIKTMKTHQHVVRRLDFVRYSYRREKKDVSPTSSTSDVKQKSTK